MGNNFLRVSKVEGYNIKYCEDKEVVFIDKNKEEIKIEKVVNSRINEKIEGLENKKLYKELKKEEDKSEGKYDLIKDICEEIIKCSVNMNNLNNKLSQLNDKDFPEENINNKKLTKEEIISYSLSKYGKEMNAHFEIVKLMDKDNVEFKDIKELKEKINDYRQNREKYLKNAKKGISKSIKEQVKENKVNRYENLLNSEIFESTIKKYKLEELINSINGRNKEVESIYDIYKEHHKKLYGTRENPIKENRDDKDIQNLDRLVREHLELRKLNSKYINDNTLAFEEIKNILIRKIRNKEMNYKLNNKRLNNKRLNNSEELINERIKSNMFRKLNYYSYEASNSLFRKRINIATNNNNLHINENKIKELLKMKLDAKPRYNEEFKESETKNRFINEIKNQLNVVGYFGSIKEIEKSLKKLEKIESFDKIDKKNTSKVQDEFNVCYNEIFDFVNNIKKYYNCIDFKDDLDISKMKELSNLEEENNRNKSNKKFIDKGEIPLLVYEEFQKVREFRNLLNHTDKSLSSLEDKIDDIEINNILEQYFNNIRLDLEHSGLYKVYNDNIKELFLNSLVNASESRYNFTPSFKEVFKNDNFEYRSRNISKEYYNLLKKIYNNIFIVDKAYQEKSYSDAVNELNTDDVKKGFSKYKNSSVKDKLLELQDRYNTRLNLKNEEGNEKYVLSCIYAHIFNKFLKDKEFEIINESNAIEIIDDIFREFEKINKDKFIRELEDMNVYFFYLLKNLSEKSRNSLEHQLKSYSKNFEDIVDIEINKVLPLFKYFKNYDNKLRFKKVNIELFFEVGALIKCDNNGSEFKTRLYQNNGVREEKQLSAHISNMFNSIYIDKVIKFFESNVNENLKISEKDIEELYSIENSKLDLNEILKIENKEEKNNKLIEFNKNKNIKSKVMLEDLASINYMLNDIYAILLKFATTSGIILNSLFSEEVANDENYEEDNKNEFFKMKNDKKKELLNGICNNKEIDRKLESLVTKLKKDEQNEENHDLNAIRNAFCHYNKELFELSILDMVNLMRYLCSFDRKQKNNVTRAIINYLSKKGISVEFQFNQDHFIENIIFKNLADEKVEPYHSEDKLNLMEELFKF